jgi:Protein kinase domain/P21-Rho-binding domain
VLRNGSNCVLLMCFALLFFFLFFFVFAFAWCPSAQPHTFELNSVQIRKVFYIQAQTAAECEAWVEAIKNAAECESVSLPFDVQHNIHVDFNSETGFSGLPPEWETMLKASGVEREEYMSAPNTMLDVLEFANKQLPGGAGHTPPPKVELPEEKALTLDQLVSSDDPMKLYKDFLKIGEGAAGEVFVATHTKTGGKVAIKKMALNGESLKLLITEISIMKTCQHANIIDYLDSFIVDDELWVAMEYMGGGCLTDILDQFETVKMTEAQIAYSSLQVCVCVCVFCFLCRNVRMYVYVCMYMSYCLTVMWESANCILLAGGDV